MTQQQIRPVRNPDHEVKRLTVPGRQHRHDSLDVKSQKNLPRRMATSAGELLMILRSLLPHASIHVAMLYAARMRAPLLAALTLTVACTGAISVGDMMGVENGSGGDKSDTHQNVSIQGGGEAGGLSATYGGSWVGGTGGAIALGGASGAGDAACAGSDCGPPHCNQLALDGTPEGKTVIRPVALATADLNGDGHLDLVTADQGDSTLSVLLGIGNGDLLARTKYPIGGSPDSLAIGDLNGDGHVDLLALSTDTGTASTLLGRGDGAFSRALDSQTGGHSRCSALADFNADTRLDIATTTADNAVNVQLGYGDGTLASGFQYPAGATPICIAVSDVDLDDRLDLVTANGNSGTVSVLLGKGDGTFSLSRHFAVNPARPDFLALGDLNRDAIPDLVLLEACTPESEGGVSVQAGLGDGSFASPTHLGPVHCASWLALVDLNGDKNLDIAPEGSGPLLGRGDGTFAAALSDGLPSQPLDFGDFDGDGKIDVAFAVGATDTATVRLGRGDGTFGSRREYRTGHGSVYVMLRDFDLDGNLDIATANRTGLSLSLLLGRGDGTFDARRDFPTGDPPDRIDSADLDNDGRPDLIALCPESGELSVLLASEDGGFAPGLHYGTQGAESVAIGDIDNDGRLDLVTENNFLLGNGDGTFGTPILHEHGVGLSGVAIGDFDSDRQRDLVVVDSATSTLRVLPGRGDGTFHAGSSYAIPNGAAVTAIGELNTDREPDIIVAVGGSSDSLLLVSVLLGWGSARFAPRIDYTVPGSGEGARVIELADINEDGRLDVALAGTGVSVLFGDGEGGFSCIQGLDPGARALAIGDLDNDGHPDVVMADSTDRVRVMLNSR